MPAKLSTAYRSMGPAALVIEAGIILTCLMSHSAFTGTVPGSVPALALLKAAIDKLREAYEAALTHDSIKIRLRNTAQEELVAILDRIAKYLEMEALTNPEVLLDTGFSKRRTASTISTGIPELTGFAVYHGPESCSAVAQAKLGAAKIVEVHATAGDPSVEKNWFHKALFVGESQMQMTGFNPGPHSFRGRIVTNAGLGAWSPYVTLILT